LIEHLPQDGKGRHDNRPHRLSDYAKQAVLDHIKTFKGCTSHYSRVISVTISYRSWTSQGCTLYFRTHILHMMLAMKRTIICFMKTSTFHLDTHERIPAPHVMN